MKEARFRNEAGLILVSEFATFIRQAGDTMKTGTLFFLIPFLFCFHSCSDSGNSVDVVVVERPSELRFMNPANGSSNVDRAEILMLVFNQRVSIAELERITIRYAGDSIIDSRWIWSISPPSNPDSVVRFRPYLWKSGRTVVVEIPAGLRGSNGFAQRDTTVRFTVAPSANLFGVVRTEPAANDTVSLNGIDVVTGFFQFNDYLQVWYDFNLVSIDSPSVFIMNSRSGSEPSSALYFIAQGVQPNATYTVTVTDTLKSIDGQHMQQPLRLTFHTTQ